MSKHDESPDPEASTVRITERRAFVRMDTDLAVTCHPTGRSREVGWAGRVKDVSNGGVGLFLEHRFRVGTSLIVELHEKNGDVLRMLRVRVVHVTPVLVDGSHCWLLGCQFEQPLSDAELEALL